MWCDGMEVVYQCRCNQGHGLNLRDEFYYELMMESEIRPCHFALSILALIKQ